jgi:hypothetical protein
MKVMVHEVGCVLLVFTQRVAFIAATTRVTKLPAVLRRVIDGLRFTNHEVIEGRIKRKLRSFVRRDRSKQVGAVRWVTEDPPVCIL